ncbi:MAG: glycosyltransferase family 39 protein [Candidatus Micrarchaeaceae archaeon]
MTLIPMQALLSIGMQISSLFQQQPMQAFYFYYYAALFIGLVIASALGYKEIKKAVSGISKTYYKYLIIIIIIFVFLEIAFVKPTHLLYNDEYIYVSIAKMMLTEHIAAVCSFSNATMCVPGTPGFIHQPLGWSFLLAIPSSIFGVSFGTAYNMELLISALSIVFIFYAAFILLRDQRVAVLSSAILAFTPLFMSYSRSNVLDVPAVTFLLLSVFFVVAYMKRKSMLIGIASVFAIAFMLSIKVDMIFALAILLLILLLDRDNFEGKHARKEIKGFLLLVVVAAIVISPGILYIYAANQVSFGAPSGQPNFSLSYLENDSLENLQFWFGTFDKVYAAAPNSYYYDEFPLTYTIFAIIGGVALLRYRKHRELAIFASWFIIVFIFYTSYYGGGVNYNAGDDVRYFISAFPAVAILAAYGFISVFNFIGAVRTRPRKSKKTASRSRATDYAIIAIMLVILFGEASWLFATIVTISPYHIYPFAAERYDERFIMQNYQQIPSNCFVLTFKPPLWYILGRGNIYASWANQSGYEAKLMNMSKGCLYFDYGISCYINEPGPGSTAQQCENVMKTYDMYPIASTILDNYSWNVTFYLYKITGLANSTTANTSA